MTSCTLALRTKGGRPLPSFDELPNLHSFKGCAWGVWGEEDQLGTVNLLTDDVVRQAATEEIRTGQSVSLNWPINFPEKPLFKRKPAQILMMPDERGYAHREDEIEMFYEITRIHSQGSQWDGMTHLGVVAHNVFYNNTSKDMLLGGKVPTPDPMNVDPRLSRLGIQNWADHGICGRGVFLDLVDFYISSGNPLPYDPWTTYAIKVPELKACAAKQGVKFRTGDILLIRVGHIKRYNESSQEEKDAVGSRDEETLAGIDQSDDMKRFLWDNHFSAIVSDQPALESWPPPAGEMFDLEKLSQVCKKTSRYTFFFSSWPLPIIGGCAAPPNAAAMF
ncbi:hypothetical protein IW261DRAFT_1423303 [Armillaria novae-zelandiae]|uniref:Cyclase n=1 Tax=Armillaria novae-zelandiae TaxID=153914 RepID=A0AA39UCT5_9AGAR|nr:hypothetical protein IW261DRAFT_1423303 [Armillaria novae-zelandiae]